MTYYNPENGIVLFKSGTATQRSSRGLPGAHWTSWQRGRRHSAPAQPKLWRPAQARCFDHNNERANRDTACSQGHHVPCRWGGCYPTACRGRAPASPHVSDTQSIAASLQTVSHGQQSFPNQEIKKINVDAKGGCSGSGGGGGKPSAADPPLGLGLGFIFGLVMVMVWFWF